MIFRFFTSIIIASFLIIPAGKALAVAPDFIVGPAKNETFLKAGETKNFSIILVNRFAEDTNFSINYSPVISDKDGNLVPSKDKILGEVKVPKNVFVKSLQSKTIEVSITADKNEEPGSRAIGIFISPEKDGQSEIRARSQIGVLAIIRVEGQAIESGSFVDLEIFDDKKVRLGGDVDLKISFANTGNVHLNPYGVLVVKNIFGKEVFAQKIDPWYVMPKSERFRILNTNTNNFFGRYTATVSLNRGYGDLIETKTISFYTFPFWFPIILVFVLLAVIFWLGKKGIFTGVAVCTLLLVGVVNVHAQMSSGNYKVQFDSVNFGGGLSSSTSYVQESTFGEVTTGEGSSANYNLHAGYQQMNEVYISISSASDVTPSPDLGSISGGTADGSTQVNVATDSVSGYALYINASTTPALQSAGDSFADYTPAGVNPDFSFVTPSSNSFFGFSPESTDTTSRFLDNGTTCATGALDTADSCWDGFDVSTKIISENSGSNTPLGTDTTIKIRAETGASRNQTAGSYVADIILTAFSK